MAYARHARRQVVDESDMLLVMRRSAIVSIRFDPQAAAGQRRGAHFSALASGRSEPPASIAPPLTHRPAMVAQGDVALILCKSCARA